MADRYSFQSPFANNERDGWFNIGNLQVTTSVAVAGLAFMGIILLTLEGNSVPVGRNFVLTDAALSGGEIWRIFTWPLVIISSNDIFGQLIAAVFFYLLGTQFESMLGKTKFAALVGTLIVVPAVLALLVGAVTNISTLGTGLNILFLGLAAGFAAAFTQARSFFGIPFWILVAVIFVVAVLGDITNRDWPSLIMTVAAGAIGLVMTKSYGYAQEVEWIPAIALPGFMTGEGRTSTGKPRTPKRRSNKAGLRSVPAPAASDAEIDALLDQVNEQGFDSLTKQQRATLKRHSEEMRRRRDQE